MSSDAQALVRQLTENPEVLESMQHMLSLLRANPPKPSSSAALNSGGHQQRVTRQPRTGYAEGTNGNAYNNHHSSSSKDHSGPSSRYSQQEQRYCDSDTESGTSASPTLTLAETERRGRRSSASGRPQQQQQQQQVSAVESEARLPASKELWDAQRRIAELEKELQRTAQRVEHLGEVVQRQKTELQAAQDRHVLEMEETRHAYDAVVRRKDEVQEEALRQLMKSRQLMVSAAKYEAVVAAKRAEKENASFVSDYAVSASKGGGGGRDAAAGGLTPSATAVNARQTAPPFGSAVKRERAEDPLKDDYAVSPQSLYPQHQPMKRAASDAWGTPTRQNRRTTQQQRTASTHTKTESPEFITSPTPVGKASTALVGGARTQSRSGRKRRTPRTPSLTNADRIASTHRGYNDDNIGKAQNSGAFTLFSAAAAASQRQLPGTSSLKLDSPTPVVSTAWTTGRSLTSSRTPPPAAPLPLSTSNYGTSRPPPQQQQQTQMNVSPRLHPARPQLTQRAAGRLAGAAGYPNALPRAVPNTISSTSSVAADGPTRSPSPVNPKRGNSGPRRFVFTGLKDGEPQQLSAAISAVGDDAAVLASELDEVPPRSTTHIVLRGTPRSVKALCGVVSGKWLVSPDYIANSQASGFWLDEGEEGGLRIFPPPLQGQRFLLTVTHPGIRGKLAQVVEYGGGEVLSEQGGKVAQDVVVLTSGDDLLRYATEGHM